MGLGRALLLPRVAALPQHWLNQPVGALHTLRSRDRLRQPVRGMVVKFLSQRTRASGAQTLGLTALWVSSVRVFLDGVGV